MACHDRTCTKPMAAASRGLAFRTDTRHMVRKMRVRGNAFRRSRCPTNSANRWPHAYERSGPGADRPEREWTGSGRHLRERLAEFVVRRCSDSGRYGTQRIEVQPVYLSCCLADD